MVSAQVRYNTRGVTALAYIYVEHNDGPTLDCSSGNNEAGERGFNNG